MMKVLHEDRCETAKVIGRGETKLEVRLVEEREDCFSGRECTLEYVSRTSVCSVSGLGALVSLPVRVGEKVWSDERAEWAFV